MILKETTYTDFILFLAVRNISYAECKSFINESEDEIIEVVPRERYRSRRFCVVGEEQLD